MRGFEWFLATNLLVSGVLAYFGTGMIILSGLQVIFAFPLLLGPTLFTWMVLLAGFYLLFLGLHAVTKRPRARSTARNRAIISTFAVVFLVPLAVNARAALEVRAFEAGASTERIAAPRARTYLLSRGAPYSNDYCDEFCSALLRSRRAERVVTAPPGAERGRSWSLDLSCWPGDVVCRGVPDEEVAVSDADILLIDDSEPGGRVLRVIDREHGVLFEARRARPFTLFLPLLVSFRDWSLVAADLEHSEMSDIVFREPWKSVFEDGDRLSEVRP